MKNKIYLLLICSSLLFLGLSGQIMLGALFMFPSGFASLFVASFFIGLFIFLLDLVLLSKKPGWYFPFQCLLTGSVALTAATIFLSPNSLNTAGKVIDFALISSTIFWILYAIASLISGILVMQNLPSFLEKAPKNSLVNNSFR